MDSIGIIGAMELEISLLLKNMSFDKEEKHAGFKFYLGKIFNTDVVVTCCNVGKVNAAACTQILIDKYNVKSIINTGIAGGIHSDVKVCDVVISSDVAHHDVRKEQMETLFPYRTSFKSDENLVKTAVCACEFIGVKDWNHHVGRIVSGECFVSDRGLKQKIVNEFSPHCVEMEGAAIGHVAHINNVPFVIIRSISDNADDSANETYNNYESVAAIQSANIVLNMIKLMKDM
ncbi:bifunctional 5'-methylthioadenosine/S-adenosylhomocysteine nucleosidase/phosphatase [Fervidicella metallireducens AeB]|uniref:adenosylhomocysteine nucleosidase n=1 Tax=Fervidicella metallireducens AeB TaxID=1403537 RepID=A0A017RXP6_9CLOT|nr:5'-methylthioadenosine/adenosylhomocysteine nucleosidase [Fervidicella metallireducens]EYE88710.1 bifunctional 5'-methylthioadenosine/S-adenosylhomocysteine nucleosidase/phosphatase [Fervidicella metallireducens AeB]